MIFVTVGTHEQQFNRLVQEVDRLVEIGIITEEVFMQIGFCTYEPKHCKWAKLISYTEMQSKIKDARIVITHGGPASFIAPLQIGKTPIVVPRKYKHNEHVNDHQVEFVKEVSERMGLIIPVFNIAELSKTVENYDSLIENIPVGMEGNNKKFNEQLNMMVSDLICVKRRK